jgi:hypothetical protein
MVGPVLKRILDTVQPLKKVPAGENVLFPNRRISRIKTDTLTVRDRILNFVDEEKKQWQNLNNVGKVVVVASALAPGRVAFNTLGLVVAGAHVGSAGFILANGLANRTKYLAKVPTT